MARTLTRILVQLSGGNYQPDSGRTVTMRTDEGAPSVVGTATESPASSGQYTVSWTEQENYGFWYVDGVKQPDWGRIWLGSVVGNVNYLTDFNISGDATVVGRTTTSQLTVTDGAQAGSVLTSDASGNATWVPSADIGTTNHATLSNLSYAASGHTGFDSTANAQFVSGNLVTRINTVSASIKQYHNELQNLAYASSGHTGFESQANAQFVSGNIVTNMLSRADFANIQRFGFLNQTETSISFNDGTGVFTLAPVGSTWSYWRLGVKHTITGSKTVDLTPVATGKTYIYIDDTSGTLTATTSPWTLLSTIVPVAEILWNASCTPKYWIIEDRHTVLIDRGMHYYLHSTVGTKLVQAGTLSGFSENVDTDAAKTFGISATIVADEDVAHSISALSDPNGVLDSYVVFYRTDLSTWAWEYSIMPFKYNTSSGWIQYDDDGTLTDVADIYSDTTWVNSYLLYTTANGDAGYVIIPGRSIFTSLESALAEDLTAWGYADFPFDEVVFAYRLTWTTTPSTSTGKCRLATTPTFLSTGELSVGGNGGTVNHALLSNLDYANSGHTGFNSAVNAQFVSGNLVTRINAVSASIKQYHNELNNLSYTLSGHTGFAGTSAMNDFTTNNHFQGDIQVTGSISTSTSPVLFGDTQVDLTRKATEANTKDFVIGWVDPDVSDYATARTIIRAGNTTGGSTKAEVRIEGGQTYEEEGLGGDVVLRPGAGDGGQGRTFISGSSVVVSAPLTVKADTTLQSTLDVTGASTLGGLLTLNANGIVQNNRVLGSSAFVGGFTGSGWKLESVVDSASRLELDELIVRGTMRVFELLIQQIRATNGSLWVTSCASVSSSVYNAGPQNWTMNFVSSNGVGHPFDDGDIILAQRANIAGGEIWRSVMEVVSVPNTGSVIAELVYGANPGPSMDYVRIGNTTDTARQGSVYMTADEVGAPYVRVINGVGAYTGGAAGTNFGELATVKTQVGNLTNITDPDFSQSALAGYGIYTQNGYFKGNIVVSPSGSAHALRTQQIMIGNITGTANSAVKIAQTGTSSTSGLYGYTTSGAESFRLGLDGTSQIAGWDFTNSAISKVSGVGGSAKGIALSADDGLASHNPTIAIYKNADGSNMISMGGSVFTGSWQNDTWGMNMRFNSTNLFSLYQNSGGTTTAYIAGWNFDSQKLYAVNGSNTTTLMVTSAFSGLKVTSGSVDTLRVGDFASQPAISASVATITGDTRSTTSSYLTGGTASWAGNTVSLSGGTTSRGATDYFATATIELPASCENKFVRIKITYSSTYDSGSWNSCGFEWNILNHRSGTVQSDGVTDVNGEVDTGYVLCNRGRFVTLYFLGTPLGSVAMGPHQITINVETVADDTPKMEMGPDFIQVYDSGLGTGNRLLRGFKYDKTNGFELASSKLGVGNWKFEENTNGDLVLYAWKDGAWVQKTSWTKP